MAQASKSVERVAAALEQAGLETRPVLLDESARTAQLAANALGVELGSIVKSLVLMVGERSILALVSGDRRADPAKVAVLLGCEAARMATADEVLASTGFAVGGVPPLGHLTPLEVLLDGSLARFPLLHAAAGAPQAVFSITYSELQELTGARGSDITFAD